MENTKSFICTKLRYKRRRETIERSFAYSKNPHGLRSVPRNKKSS